MHKFVLYKNTKRSNDKMRTENFKSLYNLSKCKRKTLFNNDKKNRIIKISLSQIKYRINFLSDIKCLNNSMQSTINIFFFQKQVSKKKKRAFHNRFNLAVMNLISCLRQSVVLSLHFRFSNAWTIWTPHHYNIKFEIMQFSFFETKSNDV